MSFPVVNGVEVAVPPPTGYRVDFENPQTDASMVRNAYWIFGLEFAMATAFLGQRMYTNAVILRKFLIDDYLILFAWVLSIAAQSCLLNAYSLKLLGVHAWEMPIDSNTKANLLVMCTTLTYIPTTILSKLTLCFFYYRLSPSLWYQYSVYFTGFLCSASLVGIWFSVLFACKPIAAGWDVRMSVGATCINRPPIYITQAAFGCITDVMLLVLPIPTVIGLQMSTRQKLGLVGLFAIGSITLITSIVRLVLLLPSLSNPDQSWSLAEGCLWVIIEANLLIMCGSLPTLRVFLKNVAPRVLGDKSTRKGSEEQSGSANFGLHTFGGSNGPRRKFDTLVELEHDTHFNRASLRPEGMEAEITTQIEQIINMTNTRIEIDPEGDTLIILPVKPTSTQSENPDPPIEKHFLCSKKHLTLASRRAAKLFSSQFKEASVESDGLYHWKFEGIFNHEAFALVLKIIHGKTRGVPRTIKLDLLADIATIVDDLECHEGGRLIRYSDDGPLTFGLPIRADVSGTLASENKWPRLTIPDKIESTRIEIFQHLFDALDNLQTRILDASVGCNAACRAMLLGSLLQAMKKLELYPRPTSPFPKLSLDNLLASLTKVQSPTYFGPKSQGPVVNCSGKWNLETTTLVVGGFFGNRSDQGAPSQPSSRLFGNGPAPQSTNTSQETRRLGDPPQLPSGPFGTILSQSSNSPRETIVLFGNKASSSVVKAPLVESEEQPATLVKHNCRLKGLIDPLINAAEKEITGLKLADFPRP
ncbi:hypothetical protein FOFC_14207 [Fusarium oxysporum]|nr:hypothetical protein FOFC_14207 [Fusarium oxysporum]